MMSDPILIGYDKYIGDSQLDHFIPKGPSLLHIRITSDSIA